MFPGLSSSSSAARVAVIAPSRRIASSNATRSGCASARMARASVISSGDDGLVRPATGCGGYIIAAHPPSDGSCRREA